MKYSEALDFGYTVLNSSHLYLFGEGKESEGLWFKQGFVSMRERDTKRKACRMRASRRYQQ